MSFVRKAWRGEMPLGVVFWGYWIGFSLVFLLALGLLLSVSEILAMVIMVPMLLLLPMYVVWIVVSVWRCAKNAKPVWGGLARVFLVMALVGHAGQIAAIGIESYKHYSIKKSQVETEKP